MLTPVSGVKVLHFVQGHAAWIGKNVAIFPKTDLAKQHLANNIFVGVRFAVMHTGLGIN